MAKVSVNKILKNKNTITILGVLACILILYIGYTSRIKDKTQPIPVYYAKTTIGPKTKITKDMIGKINIPASALIDPDSIENDYNKIENKYSNYNSVIPKGSFFHKELLVDEEDLPDAIFYDINEGERVVSFPVDMEKTYGNSIMPGNKIDIYVKLITDKGKIVYGQLYENLEVLGVKDGDGNNVFENSGETRVPAYMYFSLEEVKYLLFSSLQYVKDYYTAYAIEIVLVPNTLKFDAEEEMATEVTSDYLVDFTLNKLEQIDEQKALYNELLNEIEQLKLEKEKKDQ